MPKCGCTMTDFYPPLARAISKLTIDSPEERQELCDHARKLLVAALSLSEPRMTAPLKFQFNRKPNGGSLRRPIQRDLML
jgi:hypothetical protein